jgi:hypothetical protein
MKLMLAFLGLWMVVGLWAPPKRKLAGLVAGTAALLVLFFLVAPHYL